MKFTKLLAAATTAVIASSVALPAFAHDNERVGLGFGFGKEKNEMKMEMKLGKKTGSGSSSSRKTVDLVCVQKAVAVRETSLGTSWTTFSASMSAAYTARASALNSAWAQADAKVRQTAVKNAWTTYQTARKNARQTWVKNQTTAWNTFRTAVKGCSASTDPALMIESGVEIESQ